MNGENIIIIGERINTSRIPIEKAVRERDSGKIKQEARVQLKYGADYLDINCGSTLDKELNNILWVLETIFSEFNDLNICIDSADPNVIKEVLSVGNYGKVIVNSITAEPERFEKILPIVKKYNTEVVALTMNPKGMPNTVDERLKIVEELLSIAEDYDIDKNNLYIDPLIRPLSAEQAQAEIVLSAITSIKDKFGLKTIAGISNISYGLPGRFILNAFFLNLCFQHGLTAAIIDPSIKIIQSSIRSFSVISGKDEYCMDYIKAWREKRNG